MLKMPAGARHGGAAASDFDWHLDFGSPSARISKSKMVHQHPDGKWILT
jgi:hypothetical protein